MRALPAVAVAAAAAVLGLAGAAAGAVIGVNEDAFKVEPSLYQGVADVGLRQSVLSMIWTAGDAAPSGGQLTSTTDAINQAKADGIRVVIAIYPASGPNARALAGDGGAGFIAFATAVVSAFPGVSDFIVGNEPNRTIFMSPVDPALFTNVLAATYSAIKSVRPDASVIGVGLSPRGSGNARNTGGGSNSMFPVQYLLAMGRAYRQQGLTGKIMDAISFHPYPFPEDKPPGKPSDWPTIGMADLDRLKQAIFDAFSGTGQPTDMPIHLDEVAYQVPTDGKSGYTGAETVKTVDEATQAGYYAKIVNQVACDPRIASLSFFHFIDEADRTRFQSGFEDVSGQPRPVLDSVRQALSDTAGGTKCNGTPNAWTPATGVGGAKADFARLAARVAGLKKGASSLRIGLRMDEDATVQVGLFRIAGPTVGAADKAAISRLLAGRTAGAVKLASSVRTILAGPASKPSKLTDFPLQGIKGVTDGTYVVAVVAKATASPARVSSFLSGPVTIGAPARSRAVKQCPAGRADADGNPRNGCEVNLRTDPDNCGAVGTKVSLAPNAQAVACRNGAPVIASCKAGFLDTDKRYANGCEAKAKKGM